MLCCVQLISLEASSLLKGNREAADLGQGGLGGVERGKTTVRMSCMREEQIKIKILN